MFKLIYLPEALVVYIEAPDKAVGKKRIFCGRWKDKNRIEIALQNYFFYKEYRKRDNANIVFGKIELPTYKESLPKHLFEIIEFPDV